MSNSKFTAAILFLLLISGVSSAAAPEYAKPINAYQKKYDMSFFVWKPAGLHTKWYATYDGYPVAEIVKDQWVYGIIGNTGQLTESLIIVGSVNPNTVHILTPLPPFAKKILSNEEDEFFNEEYEATDSLKDIFKTKCDNFGIAYTKASLTPIAWESDTLKVYMWGGKKWVPIFRHHGERLSDTIKRDSNIVADMLRTNKVMWSQMDTYEFANYVRSAGYTWIDDFEANMPADFRETFADSGGGGGWDTGRD